MPLILSTSWNAFRHKDAYRMLFEIRQLGFRFVELSFNLTPCMVKRIPLAAKRLGLNVISLHNYCPIPQGLTRREALPDCYSLSSKNRSNRKLAIKFSKVSIDTAKSLGAKVLVLHCGRVEMEDRTRELIRIYEHGGGRKAKFKRIRKDFSWQRAREAGGFLKQAISSIGELSEYAGKKGIALGIENRFYYREIPSFEEMGIILSKFKGTNVFYWHDTGHARIMENLGFVKENSYLSAYARYLIGMHLHNTLGCLDHLAPCKGELNFSGLRPYLKKDTIKVIEAHYPARANEIIRSRQLLERVFKGLL